MINLLSLIEKKKILREYRFRLGAIFFFGVFLLELLTLALLIPSYATINSSAKVLAADLEAKKANALPGGDAAQVELNKIKGEIELLNATNAVLDIPPSSILEDVFEVKPKGIDISSFVYGRTETTVVLQASGVAQTREDLFAFQRSLRANAHFDDVQYAQNFITKKNDISFQLTLKLK